MKRSPTDNHHLLPLPLKPPIPPRRMKQPPPKPLRPGDLTLPWHRQAPHRRHKHLTPSHHALPRSLVADAHDPRATLLVPDGLLHGGAEARVPQDVVLDGEGVQVRCDLGLRGVGCGPVGGGEGEGVEVGGDLWGLLVGWMADRWDGRTYVAAAAWVVVHPPCSSHRFRFLYDFETTSGVFLLEADGEAEAG